MFARPTKRPDQGEKDIVPLTPAEYARTFIKLPTTTDTGIGPFSFFGRRYMIQVYETAAELLVLCCGRQTTKSTMLGNQTLAYSTTLKNYMSLYVSPSEQQTKQFSVDRLKKPILLSRYLQSFHPTSMISDVFHKVFTTGSEIRLRYAFHNADRTRGIQTHQLTIDELQDFAGEHIPVIEQTLFTANATPGLKRRRYAGTPKTVDNVLSGFYYESSQNEWLVPCKRHKFVVWNIAGEENLPLKDPSLGLVCKQCKKSIDPMDPLAHWASMRPEAKELDGEGYCIPQLIAPDVDWHKMVHDYHKYPRYRWMNECAGRPYDSAAKPITKDQVMAWCDSSASITRSAEFARNLPWALSGTAHGTFMGVDHGSGENSFTYVVILSYMGGYDKLRVIYFERFTGELTEPPNMLAHLKHLASVFRVMFIGADYGGGYQTNDALLREFGVTKVHRYQYAAVKAKIEWNDELGYYQIARTEVMTDILEAVKRGCYVFPRWEEMEMDGGLGREMCNLTSEVRKKEGGSVEQLYFSKPRRLTDDGMHALTYATLASTLFRPRPDIFLPGITSNKDVYEDGSLDATDSPGHRYDINTEEYD